MSRATFAMQIVCVLLVGWLILLSSYEDVRPEQGATPVAPDLHSELRQIRDRLDGMSAAAGSVEHHERREVTRDGRVVSADVAAELREMRRSLRRLEQAIGRIPKPDTFRLADIRKRYPATDWASCKALLEKAHARAKEFIRKHHPGETNAITITSLREAVVDRTLVEELKLKRPEEVLERFGAPTNVSLDESGFQWDYESPERRNGQPVEGIVLYFREGCVWMAEVRDLP